MEQNLLLLLKKIGILISKFIIIIVWSLTLLYIGSHFGYEQGHTDGRYDLSEIDHQLVVHIVEECCDKDHDKPVTITEKGK